jgi:ribosomal protein S27E
MKKLGIGLGVFAILVLMASSCEEYFNCLNGNGVEASETRLVSEFTNVVNTTAFEVEVIYDSEYSVEVFADENLMPYINTNVISGELIIQTNYNRCLNSYNPILIEVHMPTVEQVELTGSGEILISYFDEDEIKFVNSGSGNIIAWNFECNFLTVKNSGSGDINVTDVFTTATTNCTLTGSGDIILTGAGGSGIYLLTGSGSLVADNYPVNTCSANNTGSGHIFCQVYQELNIVLTASGNVIYSGTPEIHQLVTGSGSVIPSN